MTYFARFIFAIFALFTMQSLPAFSQDIATLLMNSTFEIGGVGAAPGQVEYGTVFILGKPTKENPKLSYFVLVTAAHVLEGIAGDQAILFLRHKEANGTFTAKNRSLEIRHNGAALYQKNPEADVAAMYVALPPEATINLLPIALLADDARLEKLNLHPGDELQCLGFPLHINLNGFAVIRNGLLASYPITPAKVVHSLYYNFHTFPGNSGGPVYFSFMNRAYEGSLHLGDMQQGIIGLVSQQVNSNLPEYKAAPLDISVIVPSPYIIDTINMLPDEPAQK